MTEINIETKSPFKHNENDFTAAENIEPVHEFDAKNKPKKSKKTHFYEPPNENSPIGILMKWWPGFKASVYARFQKSVSSLTFLSPLYEKLEDYFECVRAGSSVETEIFAGFINFFSCMYVLAVVPQQMGKVGYDTETSAAVISFVTGIGSILCGIFTNTPLIVSPATAVSIYFVTNLQQYSLSLHSANLIVMYGGIFIVCLGIIGPLSRLISKVIPSYIQIGTTIGIGLLTALSGYSEINLVVPGRYTLLTVGTIDSQVCIAISGIILIAIGIYYHSRFAYLIGLVWGTFLWWSSQNAWPNSIASLPDFSGDFFGPFHDTNGILVTFEMIFLIILTLFGLAKALCELAYITTTFEAIPKGRLLLVIIGLTNIGSGFIYGPPIILSPECASGIKAGARTGLSSVVAGMIFLLSVFFAPLFTAIPSAATSPVLIMIGMILFQNVKYIDFSSKYGIAAFITLTLIPFTDSIMGGLGFGYATFFIISFLNGDVKENAEKFLAFYFGSSEDETEGSKGGAATRVSLNRLSKGTNDIDMTVLPISAKGRRTRSRGGSGGGPGAEGSNSSNHSTEESDSVENLETGNNSAHNDATDGPTINTSNEISASKQASSPSAAPSPTSPGGNPRNRRTSSAAVVMQKVRRGTVAFLNDAITDTNLENDIVRIDTTRF
jgi:AGZA family xanthine/uracil permease-like MFS transporter